MVRPKPRVLFLCTGNACRSQMAEGWLRHLAGEQVDSVSAGTRPAGLHPDAVLVMGEVGVDLSAHTSDPVTRHLDDPPDLVIAVCDQAARSCPSFPGGVPRLDWSFPDPAGARGSRAEVLAEFRRVRDAIRARIEAWLATGLAPLGSARP